MSDDRQHRIRQRAHAIWERHGSPHGHDRDHWDQATREIDAEDAAVSELPRATAAAKPAAIAKSKAAAKPAKAPAAKKPAEKKAK